MTKLFNWLFAEPSSTHTATRKVTHFRLIVAIFSHLYINPIGTIGVVLYVRHRTWQAASLLVLGYLFSVFGSLVVMRNSCSRLRRSVLEGLGGPYRHCALRRRSIWDYLKKEDIEKEVFATFEERGGRTFAAIYRHTVEWTRIFEYDLSYSAISAAHLQGEIVNWPESPLAYVDQHGYAYVFVPHSRATGPWKRFQLAHELGHVFVSASSTKLREVFEPYGLFMTLGFAAFNLKWTALSTAVFIVLSIVFLDYFTPRETYLRKTGRLISECGADMFAVSVLEESEKRIVRDRLESLSFGLTDDGLTAELNTARRIRLLRELRGEDVDYGEAAVYNTLDPVWKFVLVCAIGYASVEPTWHLVTVLGLLTMGTAIAVLIIQVKLGLQDDSIVKCAETMCTERMEKEAEATD
jgi:hypothetical protein